MHSARGHIHTRLAARHRRTRHTPGPRPRHSSSIYPRYSMQHAASHTHTPTFEHRSTQSKSHASHTRHTPPHVPHNCAAILYRDMVTPTPLPNRQQLPPTAAVPTADSKDKQATRRTLNTVHTTARRTSHPEEEGEGEDDHQTHEAHTPLSRCMLFEPFILSSPVSRARRQSPHCMRIPSRI